MVLPNPILSHKLRTARNIKGISPTLYGVSVAFFVAGLIAAFAIAMYTFRVSQGLEAKNRLLGEQSQQNAQTLEESLASVSAQLRELQAQDQLKRNEQLQKDIKATHDSYQKTLSAYELLADLRDGKGKHTSQDALFAAILNDLSSLNYASADAKLRTLNTQLESELAKQATTPGINLASLPANNSPPGSGYSRQKVVIDIGEFAVDIIAADLNSTRVIVDTASDGTCTKDCPVLPLATYISRSGAYAGINGSYFCPESYPQCAEKKNTFDTLLMNKNKVYFNSDNNVYSNVPVAMFSGNSARFMAHSSEWGRDTGVDAVIANQPLLVLNGEVQFGGNSDPKLGSKGVRGFLGNTNNTAYIGFVRNATVAEAARVLKAMGMKHAINLDSGGSSALWSGGYKIGPGRSIPNAVLFVKK